VVLPDAAVRRQTSLWHWSCSRQAQVDAAADDRVYGGCGIDKGCARECQKQ